MQLIFGMPFANGTRIINRLADFKLTGRDPRGTILKKRKDLDEIGWQMNNLLT